jgi:hypothetical protein
MSGSVSDSLTLLSSSVSATLTAKLAEKSYLQGKITEYKNRISTLEQNVNGSAQQQQLVELIDEVQRLTDGLALYAVTNDGTNNSSVSEYMSHEGVTSAEITSNTYQLSFNGISVGPLTIDVTRYTTSPDDVKAKNEFIVWNYVKALESTSEFRAKYHNLAYKLVETSNDVYNIHLCASLGQSEINVRTYTYLLNNFVNKQVFANSLDSTETTEKYVNVGQMVSISTTLAKMDSINTSIPVGTASDSLDDFGVYWTNEYSSLNVNSTSTDSIETFLNKVSYVHVVPFMEPQQDGNGNYVSAPVFMTIRFNELYLPQYIVDNSKSYFDKTNAELHVAIQNIGAPIGAQLRNMNATPSGYGDPVADMYNIPEASIAVLVEAPAGDHLESDYACKFVYNCNRAGFNFVDKNNACVYLPYAGDTNKTLIDNATESTIDEVVQNNIETTAAWMAFAPIMSDPAGFYPYLYGHNGALYLTGNNTITYTMSGKGKDAPQTRFNYDENMSSHNVSEIDNLVNNMVIRTFNKGKYYYVVGVIFGLKSTLVEGYYSSKNSDTLLFKMTSQTGDRSKYHIKLNLSDILAQNGPFYNLLQDKLDEHLGSTDVNLNFALVSDFWVKDTLSTKTVEGVIQSAYIPGPFGAVLEVDEVNGVNKINIDDDIYHIQNYSVQNTIDPKVTLGDMDEELKECYLEALFDSNSKFLTQTTTVNTNEIGGYDWNEVAVNRNEFGENGYDVIVMDFCGPSCLPCRVNKESILRLQSKYVGSNIKFINVIYNNYDGYLTAADFPDNADGTSNWHDYNNTYSATKNYIIEDQHMFSSVLIDSLFDFSNGSRRNRWEQAFNIEGVPAYILLKVFTDSQGDKKVKVLRFLASKDLPMLNSLLNDMLKPEFSRNGPLVLDVNGVTQDSNNNWRGNVEVTVPLPSGMVNTYAKNNLLDSTIDTDDKDIYVQNAINLTPYYEIVTYPQETPNNTEGSRTMNILRNYGAFVLDSNGDEITEYKYKKTDNTEVWVTEQNWKNYTSVANHWETTLSSESLTSWNDVLTNNTSNFPTNGTRSVSKLTYKDSAGVVQQVLDTNQQLEQCWSPFKSVPDQVNPKMETRFMTLQVSVSGAPDDLVNDQTFISSCGTNTTCCCCPCSCSSACQQTSSTLNSCLSGLLNVMIHYIAKKTLVDGDNIVTPGNWIATINQLEQNNPHLVFEKGSDGTVIDVYPVKPLFNLAYQYSSYTPRQTDRVYVNNTYADVLSVGSYARPASMASSGGQSALRYQPSTFSYSFPDGTYNGVVIENTKSYPTVYGDYMYNGAYIEINRKDLNSEQVTPDNESTYTTISAYYNTHAYIYDKLQSRLPNGISPFFKRWTALLTGLVGGAAAADGGSLTVHNELVLPHPNTSLYIRNFYNKYFLPQWLMLSTTDLPDCDLLPYMLVRTVSDQKYWTHYQWNTSATGNTLNLTIHSAIDSQIIELVYIEETCTDNSVPKTILEKLGELLSSNNNDEILAQQALLDEINAGTVVIVPIVGATVSNVPVP